VCIILLRGFGKGKISSTFSADLSCRLKQLGATKVVSNKWQRQGQDYAMVNWAMKKRKPWLGAGYKGDVKYYPGI